MRKKIKRAITLIEIMIVILLIGLIGGALAFNMRGSIDEGKAFKSEQNISKIYDILMLEYAKGDKSLEEIKKNYEAIVKSSPLAKGDSLLKGGWNESFDIAIKTDELVITSKKLDLHKKKSNDAAPKK